MALVNVQFQSGAADAAIVSVFGCPQDEQAYPHQGEVEEDDPRYLEFLKPPVVEPVTDPVEKLWAFLAANPDVAQILK